MDPENQSQSELSFTTESSGPAFQGWEHHRQQERQRLMETLGLPFGHPVELWLFGGVRLRGVLRTRENLLWFSDQPPDSIELCVDGVVFKRGEIESCVRLD